MSAFECEYEAEVLSSVVQSRWPERVDAGLRAHVSGCGICSDIVAVAGWFDEARDEMRAGTVVPDAGRIWWAAQLRARREAIETAGRPITAVQAIAFACAVGLLGACLGATSKWFQSVLGAIASSVAEFDVKALSAYVPALLADHGVLVLGTALVLFLVPTALYVALGRE